SFVRFYYEEIPEKRAGLFYNTLKVPIISLSIVIIVILLLNKKLTVFLFEASDYRFTIILIIGITAQLLFRYGLLVIRMQQKGNLYSIIQILSKVFNLSLILFLFYLLNNSFEILIYSRVLTLTLLVIAVIYVGKDFWSIDNIKIQD